jgi:hypothetical protein
MPLLLRYAKTSTASIGRANLSLERRNATPRNILARSASAPLAALAPTGDIGDASYWTANERTVVPISAHRRPSAERTTAPPRIK